MLLVEDETAVRTLLASVLERAGYRLLEARDGQSALDVAAAHDGPIHLVVSDIVMPGMNGGELAERLTALRPETKMILISGYADNLIVEHARRHRAPHSSGSRSLRRSLLAEGPRRAR